MERWTVKTMYLVQAVIQSHWDAKTNTQINAARWEVVGPKNRYETIVLSETNIHVGDKIAVDITSNGVNGNKSSVIMTDLRTNIRLSQDITGYASISDSSAAECVVENRNETYTHAGTVSFNGCQAG